MALAMFRDAGGVTHYLHIVPINNGTETCFFHCSPSHSAQAARGRIAEGPHYRDDYIVNCLWCVTDTVR